MKKIRKVKNYTRANYRKFGWLGGKEKLKKTHAFLNDSDKIRCAYEVFESHFINNSPIPDPVHWYGTGSELIHVFSELMDEYVIPEANDSLLLICDHFYKPDNTRFNPRSLSVVKSRDKTFRICRFIKELFARIELVQ